MLSAVLPSAMLASGCECDPPEASVSITTPADMTALTEADDVNADEAGVQINVVVATEGLDGELLSLTVSGADAGSAIVTGAEMTFEATIPVGSQVLTATAREGTISSENVTVTLGEDSGCPTVTYVTPTPPAGGNLRLGQMDNTSGGECSEGDFETSIVVSTNAPDGTEARVLVGGMPSRTATASGGVIRFEGVGLTAGGLNQVSVAVGGSASCAAVPYPATIEVDCDAILCRVSAPVVASGFLNQDNDVSDEEGFQGDFTVETDTDGSGQPIRLVIDGNETDAPEMTPSGTSVTFGSVDLTEGVHRIRAVCQDSLGNITRSVPAEYTVDITPCAVGMDSPTEGQLFVEADDINDDPTAIDILALGTAGADCTGLRVAQCSGIDAVAFGDAEASWSAEVALASTAMQDLCAEAQDEAGNISRATVGVRVNTEAPQLEIASPVDGTNFNIAGDATHTADLMSGNDTCEAAFDVYCTAVGVDVEILRATSLAVLATASCVADASVPAPYTGRATFAMVSLPSVQTGDQFNVIARQMEDRLEGSSAPIALRSDCVAPTPFVTRPMCGAVLRPATQDEDMGTAGFQYRTVVQNAGGDDITLQIQTSDATVLYSSTNTSGATTLNFDDADYGAGGELSIIADGVDNAGNNGTSGTCTVTVADLPTIAITSPTAGAVLGGPGSCSSGEIPVTGTTDAADGSAVVVSINGTDTSDTTSGGAFSVCATAADGRDLTVRATVTDGRGSASAMVTVTIDTMPPTTPVNDLALSVVDRRGGVVQFTWTGVEDEGGLALDSYQLRCADAAITDESGWNAATPAVLTTLPSTGSPSLSENLSGFRVANTVHCALRGVDPAGSFTPLQPSIEVTLEFLTQVVTDTSGTPILAVGSDVTPLGDINGDGIGDFAVGGANGLVLYFGSDAGLSATPDVQIFGSGTLNHELLVAGLGDFNGDGVPDFAVADVDSGTIPGFTTGGSVQVFFGRPSSSPWPSTCVIGAGSGCTEDLHFEGTSLFFGPNNAFGASIAPAGDFDGDGLMDLVVADYGFAGTDGAAIVILGRASFATGQRYEVPANTGTEPDGYVIGLTPGAMSFFSSRVGTAGGSIVGDSRHDVLIQHISTDSTVYAATGQAYSGSGLQNAAAGTLVVVGVDADPGRALGESLTSAGDIDGNGTLDILLADNRSGSAGGVLRLLNGSTSGLPVTASSGTGSQFGESVAMAYHPSPSVGLIGDIDADGTPDLFAGSIDDAGSSDGLAAFFYGTATPVIQGRADAALVVTEDLDIGERVAAFIGDVNGDGYSDMCVGEAGASRFQILY